MPYAIKNIQYYFKTYSVYKASECTDTMDIELALKSMEEIKQIFYKMELLPPRSYWIRLISLEKKYSKLFKKENR
jgi:hypothetical protein